MPLNCLKGYYTGGQIPRQTVACRHQQLGSPPATTTKRTWKNKSGGRHLHAACDVLWKQEREIREAK